MKKRSEVKAWGLMHNVSNRLATHTFKTFQDAFQAAGSFYRVVKIEEVAPDGK